MKTNNPIPSHGKAAALLATALLLSSTTKLGAQITFDLSHIGGLSSGAHADVFATGLDYQVSGPTANNIISTTFGQSYHIDNTAAGASTVSLNLAGDITGTPTPIPAGSQVAISYAFTLAKNASVSGPVTWAFNFSDNVNLAGTLVGPNLQAIGSGGVFNASGAGSSSFSSSGVYTFTSNVNLPNSFGANLVLSYVADSTSALLDVTMLNTGLGGQGISISAVPEPSACGAFAGLALASVAVWRRSGTARTKASA